MSCPPRLDRARRRRASRPESRSKIVVLPAPLCPMRPTICPGRDDQVDAVDDGDATEALGQPARLERRRGRPRSSVGRSARRTAAGSRGGGRAEEHGAEDVGPVEQLGGGAGEADAALLQEHGPLGQQQRDVRPTARRRRRSPVRVDVADHRRRARPTTVGRQAEGELVDAQHPGRTAIAMASESICCSPPDRSPARVSRRAASGGNSASARSRAPADGVAVVADQPAGQAQVLRHRQRREDARARRASSPGRERRSVSGAGSGDRAHRRGAAVPPVGGSRPQTRPQQRGLPRAVGAEQRDAPRRRARRGRRRRAPGCSDPYDARRRGSGAAPAGGRISVRRAGATAGGLVAPHASAVSLPAAAASGSQGRSPCRRRCQGLNDLVPQAAPGLGHAAGQQQQHDQHADPGGDQLQLRDAGRRAGAARTVAASAPPIEVTPPMTTVVKASSDSEVL